MRNTNEWLVLGNRLATSSLLWHCPFLGRTFASSLYHLQSLLQEPACLLIFQSIMKMLSSHIWGSTSTEGCVLKKTSLFISFPTSQRIQAKHWPVPPPLHVCCLSSEGCIWSLCFYLLPICNACLWEYKQNSWLCDMKVKHQNRTCGGSRTCTKSGSGWSNALTGRKFKCCS